MADDEFSFADEVTFRRGEVGGGVDLAKLEADYAELFTEVIWDGVITPEKRARLDRAAEIFGLDRERTQRLEQALQAAYEARHQVRVREESIPGVTESSSVMPFEQVNDPRFFALQRRIGFLEARNGELEARVVELTRELEEARHHAAVDVDLSGMTGPQRSGPLEADPHELHSALCMSPRDPHLLHGLYRALKRGADLDQRFCTAQVLVHLGLADEAERATYAAHETGTLIRPSRSLTQDEWHDLLFHPDEERLPGEIFAAVASAALLSRLAARRDPAPDPACKVDLATSTLQAARCFGWAAAILGMRPPPLYADPSYPGMVQMIVTAPLSSRLGRVALAGRNPRELAFAAGRHLSAYREEHFVLTLVSSTKELEDLFLASLSIGNPGLPMTTDVKQRVAPIARAIEPLLDAHAMERLRAAFIRFVELGGRTKLRRWALAADKTAACAGLILANEFGAARAVLGMEDPAHVEERIDDLIVYATSERYSQLRKRIGIAIGV